MTRPRRKPPAAYHHGNLQTDLLRAAVQVAATRGVEAIQLRGLARELGVSCAAPFRHFADRTALLLQIAEEGYDKLFARLDAVVAATPLDVARARAVEYVRFAAAEPGYFRVMHAPEVIRNSARIQALIARNHLLLDETIGATHRGEASPTVARRSASVLAAQALTFGLGTMIASGLLGPVSEEEAKRLAEEVTAVLGAGLLPRG